MDHEVRLRILESTARDTHNLLRWILAFCASALIVPIALHYFQLT